MRFTSTTLVALILVTPTFAQETRQASSATDPVVQSRDFEFDFIPGDALMSLTVRDLSDLKRKLIGVSKKSNGQLSGLISFGIMIGENFFRDTLGLKQSFDPSGSAGFVVFDEQDKAVAILPVTNLRDVADVFEVKEKTLRDGKLVRFENSNRLGYEGWMGVRVRHGKPHLVIGDQGAIARVLKEQNGLANRLSKRTKATFVQDDIFYTLDVAKAQELVTNLESGEVKRMLGFLGKEFLEQSAEMEVTRLGFGLRFDEGIDNTLALEFDGDKSRAFLSRLQNDSRKTELKGLPSGRVVFATSRSSGSESGDLIGSAMSYLSNEVFEISRNRIQDFFTPQHLHSVLGLMQEGLKRVPVSRAALYHNDLPEQNGGFCVISILDTEDGEEFIKELREIVPIVDASLDREDEVTETIGQATIDKMVSRIADDNPRVRQFMITKLRLVGRPALTALRELAKSDDPGTRGRANELIRDIESDLAIEHTQFLTSKAAADIELEFGYEANFEQRLGHSVDVIRLGISEQHEDLTKQLGNTLGPEWNQIRVARVADQVVLMFGSNKSLFDKTIKNLEDGSEGIESEKHIANFHQREPDSLMSELHLSAALIAELMGRTQRKDDQPNDTSTSSIGMSVLPQWLQVDLFIPAEEIQTGVRLFMGL